MAGARRIWRRVLAHLVLALMALYASVSVGHSSTPSLSSTSYAGSAATRIRPVSSIATSSARLTQPLGRQRGARSRRAAVRPSSAASNPREPQPIGGASSSGSSSPPPSFVERTQSTQRSEAWVRALDLFDAMNRAGVQPDTRTYNDLMTICLRCNQLDQARLLYARMGSEGVDVDARTLGAMAGVYAKSSDWENALGLIDIAKEKGVVPNFILFTNVITACAKEGKWEEALGVIERMKASDVSPSRVTYNAAIHACSKAGKMDVGLGLVDDMKADSVGVDVVTYTSLIAGHMWSQDIKSVISTFRAMQGDGVSPNGQTFGSVLTALTRAGEWRSALDAYQSVIDAKITGPTSVHNMAITAHLHLGEWLKAVQVYMKMRNQRVPQDLTSHCLAIKSYFGAKQVETAMSFLRQAVSSLKNDGGHSRRVLYETAARSCQSHGLWQEAMEVCRMSVAHTNSSSLSIFNAGIKACAQNRKMMQAFEVYRMIGAQGLEATPVTFAGLMSATAHHQASQDEDALSGWQLALMVKTEMEAKGIPLDLVTYTALITALGRGGRWQRAFHAFTRMQESEVKPNLVTYSALITAYGIGGQWQRALRAFAECEAPNEMVYSCLISAMGKSGKWEKALQVLADYEETMGKPGSTMIYNGVLMALAKCGRVPKTLEIFEKMQKNKEAMEQGLNTSSSSLPVPNRMSWAALAEACDVSNDLDLAMRMIDSMLADIKPSLGISNRLISMMTQNKRWKEAVTVFDKMVESHVRMDRYKYASMITACVRSKDRYLVSVKAHNLFRDLQRVSIAPGIVEYGAIINACAKEKNLQRALLLYDQMQDEQLEPDVAIYTSLIKACAHDGEWERAIELFEDIEQRAAADPSLGTPSTFTYNALITTLTNCRQRKKAMHIFNKMNHNEIPTDRVTYDRLIQGYEVIGDWEEVLRIMHMMQPHVQPTAITYQRAISACQLKGQWQRALMLYEDMQSLDIKPRDNTYLALYDACLEAQKPDIAATFYQILQQSTAEDPLARTDDMFEEDEDEEFDAYYDPEPLESEAQFEDYDPEA